ncbi:hypothetical protein O0I10_005343 [Lichtheimia ornata]|uniref:Uncharacterized protein n=1 Tax=Lichtheimia ornata TaxID=688661 RepID=A0AAD7V7E2_9FUNG|nr:uncharacterized protein O0I10_005343 [Lichtheimia ornata]KAJ8658961.1 hypothetical protein O0I10_005343 [Lichtheimia ornata]
MRLSVIAIAITLVVAGVQAQSPNVKQDAVQVTQSQQNNIGPARIAVNKRYDDGNLHGDYEGDDEDGEEEDEDRRRPRHSRHRGSRGRSGQRGGRGVVEPAASKLGRIVDNTALGKLGGVTHSDPDV